MIRLKEVIERGGATLDPSTLEPVTFKNGYQVSKKDLVVISTDILTSEAFKDIIRTVQLEVVLKHDLDNDFIGLWVDNGYLYIDISTRFNHKEYAMKQARAYKQKAIFDWANFESVTVESED